MTALAFSSPEIDDLALAESVKTKDGKSFFAFKNELPESFRADRNFARRPDWLDKNNPALNLNIGRRFGKITTIVHFGPSPLNATEREQDAEQSQLVKPLKSLTLFVRRINDAASRAATVQPPDFANDNEAPREAEAA